MISRRTFLACGSAAPLGFAARRAEAQVAWRLWIGPKFGTRIDYPSDLFSMLPEPDARDGRTFVAADGARIAAWGAFTNVIDFESAIAMTREGGDYTETTYRRRNKDWAVISGFRSIEGRRSVFYERYFLDPRQAIYHCVVITYPEEAKAIYDSIVGRIAGSLDRSRYEASGER